METNKILITGANGTIGQILQEGLPDYQITPLDLPDHDLANAEVLENKAPGHSAIIHLAWDTKTDNYLSRNINPSNSAMFFNVYQSALKHNVKRVIMASSVHADGFYNHQDSKPKSPYDLPNPDSPYGAHKVYLESIGRWFASEGLEVVCIRFGGISQFDKAHPANLAERGVFLSRNDGVSLVRSILQAESVPNNFAIVYGISNNNNLIHDLSNPFNWTPVDRAEDHLD